ncbi:MAG TPA: hypothetical protein VER83_03980, partial [Candidatus Nanopelagicales bacterium]|nr:hypothetical protein [Candidatus Nanopelagicales bacterium]
MTVADRATDRAADAARATDLGAALDAQPAAEPGVLRAATVPVDDLDAIALFAAAREIDLEAALWLQPSEGMAIVGIGRAWAVGPDGPARFTAAGRSWRELLGRAARGAEAIQPAGLPRGAGPLLLGGLGFTGRAPAADD